jgi:hydrogenase/urease accessory protein HupE
VRFASLILSAVWIALPNCAGAHPAPFSALDLRLADGTISATLVLHVVDVAHDLAVADPDRLLESTRAEAALPLIGALLTDRLRITGDGRLLVPVWLAIEPVPDRHAVRIRFMLRNAPSPAGVSAATLPPAVLNIRAVLFPYDPSHQTFLNIYEDKVLKYQAICGRDDGDRTYYAGTVRGAFAVFRTFVPAGVHHILVGPDHVLFLIGLLLLGGGFGPLVRIVTAFTIGHSLTLSLAALGVFTPSGRIVEPIIALSIVFVGVDNLLMRRSQGRDVRLWIALIFGLVHGFGFASVLRTFGLPREALAQALFSFNLGVEIGQVLIVITIVGLLAAVHRRDRTLGHRLATAGSIAVIAAGAYWFIERVFFS